MSSTAQAVYRDILKELVIAYAGALYKRRVTRQKAQDILAALIFEATGGAESACLSDVERWLDAVYPTADGPSLRLHRPTEVDLPPS